VLAALLRAGAQPYRVHGVGRHVEDVPGAPRDHEVTGARLGIVEGPAQLRDLHLQRAEGPPWRVGAPEVLDQAVGRDQVAPVHEQVGEQGADLRSRHHDRRAGVGPHRQRPEHPESHGYDRNRRTVSGREVIGKRGSPLSVSSD
jgi:hypothetical protein